MAQQIENTNKEYSMKALRGQLNVYAFLMLCTFIYSLKSWNDDRIEKKYSLPIWNWYKADGAFKMLPELNLIQEQQGLNPSIVYSGKGAIAIPLSNIYENTRTSPEFSQGLLVKAPSGSYFEVEVDITPWRVNKTLEECSDNPAMCARFHNPQQLSPTEAKAQYFHSDVFTRDSYIKFFVEEPPIATKPV